MLNSGQEAQMFDSLIEAALGAALGYLAVSLVVKVLF